MIQQMMWLSGALLIAAEWQLEVIRIRATRKEKFSLPFFMTSDREYFMWSLVFLLTMAISFILLAFSLPFQDVWLGTLLFLLGFWNLAEVQFKTIANLPYKPPMIIELASEEIEMDLGIKKLERTKHVSFWGDVWLLFIFAAYIALLV
jgi:hypothetical protein